MADTVTKAVRSRIMSSVKQKHTKPELLVRSLLHRLGLRFRLHRKDLPGRPDIVLPKFNTVIFVHGCFWHQHENCSKSRRPSSNRDFWDAKLDANVARDERKETELVDLGWRVINIWQCQTKDSQSLLEKLKGIFRK